MDFLSLIQNNFLALALVMLAPILLWMWYFNMKHHESGKSMLLAFLAGMVSVLPIKLYEKYWSTAVLYVEHINIFRHLADLVHVPSLSTLLAFLLVNVIVALGIYLFVMVVLFFLDVATGDSTAAIYKKKVGKILESPFLFVSVGLIIGLVAFTGFMTLHEKVWFFLLVGMIEEFTKHLCVRFSDEEKIHTVDDAIAFSILVALGFAFLENILYMQNYLTTMAPSPKDFMVYFVLRSSVSVLAHVSFSAIFGYYYGVALFAHEFYREKAKQAKSKALERFYCLCHVKGETVFHEEKILEGLLISMILHAAFNSLLEFNQMAVMLILLMGMVITVLGLYHRVKWRHEHPFGAEIS